MDAPKLSLFPPLDGSREDLVAITITLPMGWKNYLPMFCTDMETVEDLENSALRCNQLFCKNKLDDHAEAVVIPAYYPLQSALAGLIRNPYLRRSNTNPTAYVYVFIDYFLGLFQGPVHRRRHVRRTLFHALDKVLRYLDSKDTSNREYDLYLKKLETGNCTWSTC